MHWIILLIVPIFQDLKSEINQEDGVAIHGYDVVSYFTDGESKKGQIQFSYNWENTDWLFSSRKNLDQFSNDPEKYAPQFGGYCAWGMRDGYKADSDPKKSWTIVDNKLYLNYNKSVKKGWLPEKIENIKIANDNWSSFKHK